MENALLPTIDEKRLEASAKLDPKKRSTLGQFMTPSAIARFMASLFTRWPQSARLLDPGAGIGALTDAFFEQFMARAPEAASLHVNAYEIDPLLLGYLRDHFAALAPRASGAGRDLSFDVSPRDFIAEATYSLGMGAPERFTHAILNPPYKKINTGSLHRGLLSQVGVETVNLYAAFLALAVALVADKGEVVAIVPRSFCNGTYFRPFREWLLSRAAIRHLHVFESRTKAFRDDEVLQENVIIHLVRGEPQGDVRISTSHDAGFLDYSERLVAFNEIVKPTDAGRFVHIPTVELNGFDSRFSHSLRELGLDVATGPVVDFRVRAHWLAEACADSVPLLYAHHFSKGKFTWPREHKKPNALRLNDDTRKWLLPRGYYCITKRFSAKEERRRLVAYVLGPDQLPYNLVGFENHLNVFHNQKAGLCAELAHGLAVFLNSTVADQAFRTFSGHTQVNATDLRAMHYPGPDALAWLGRWAINHPGATQEQIDEALVAHGE